MPYGISPYTSSETTVRPSLRFAGALICVGVAVMFAVGGWNSFAASGPQLNSPCERGRSGLWCELGKFLLSLLPASLHGPVLGVIGFVIGVAALGFAWRLAFGGAIANDRDIKDI